MICVSVFTIFMMIYVLFNHILDGSLAVEHKAKKWIGKSDSQEYCSSQIIEENKAIAFINYDCTPINKITKGIKNCNGKYYIFINKIDNKWIIDETSKTIIW